MRRVPIAAKVLVIIVLVVTARVSTAEGNCPPGHYPIGGQGVQGCAPMGGDPSTSGVSRLSRPAGRWKLTWGAVAAAADGAVGLFNGAPSKRLAEQGAMRICRRQDGVDCKIIVTYKHQCVAGVRSADGIVAGVFVTGPSIEVAESRALSRCAGRSGIGCKVFATDCTEPRFVRF